jgi:SprT protein
MPKNKVPLSTLAEYIPENTYGAVEILLNKYSVQLTVTRSRATVLGDYRPAYDNKGHRISVNGNLNRYSFLITLLHELAHLLNFIKFGNRVSPHGPEWKFEFKELLIQFIALQVFPDDIRCALEKSLQNPAASSCGDANLMRVLEKYNPSQPNIKRIEELAEGEIFEIKGGRQFIRGAKRRSRYLCKSMENAQSYLFHALYPVKIMKGKA